MIPSRLVTVGKSKGLEPGDKAHREHVVPRLAIIKECHSRLCDHASDDEIAALIRDHTRIVLITEEECRRLDRKDQHGLRQIMPTEWAFGGDLFARLRTAGIEWDPVVSADQAQVGLDDPTS